MSKLFSHSLLGAAMGVALASGCGPTAYVTGTGHAFSTGTEGALILDEDTVLRPFVAGGTTPELRVVSARLEGTYNNCLGKVSGVDGWVLPLGQAAPRIGKDAVKIAQADFSCELQVHKLVRTVQPTAGTPADESYEFQLLDPNSGKPTGTHSYISIRDGYFANNLRMLVSVAGGLSSGLINIAGNNTGNRASPSTGGYQNDWDVTVMTGATAGELNTTVDANAAITYSYNLQTISRELPAPTYSMDYSGVTVQVNPTGTITASSFGSFKFGVATLNGVTQAGADYITSVPGDAHYCIANCGSTDENLKTYTSYTELPTQNAWRMKTDAEKYDTLFERFRILKSIHQATLKNITTSDKSVNLPILSVFPLGTQMFSPPPGNNPTGPFTNKRNHAIVILRSKAQGATGSEFDAASGVNSFQAFQIEIAPPSNN